MFQRFSEGMETNSFEILQSNDRVSANGVGRDLPTHPPAIR